MSYVQQKVFVGLVSQVRSPRFTKDGNMCLDLKLISLDSSANGKFYQTTLFNDEANRIFQVNDLVVILGSQENAQFTTKKVIRLQYTWKTQVLIGENEISMLIGQKRCKEISSKKMKYLNKCTGIYRYFERSTV